jgi:hypothetical protein
MDEELTKIFNEEGLEECIDIVVKELGIKSLDEMNYQVSILGLESINDAIDELIPENYIHTLKNLFITFIISKEVSQSHNYNTSQDDSGGNSTKLSEFTAKSVREIYLNLLNDLNKTPQQRAEFFYKRFIQPNLKNQESVDDETIINFEGRNYKFNKNSICIGRGCQEYPADIVIPERNNYDKSISRVNCVIIKVKTVDGFGYHLFDAWSCAGTRVTKTNPVKTFVTQQPNNVNIISWDAEESVFISCGDTLCNNKIHVLSSTQKKDLSNPVSPPVLSSYANMEISDLPECPICFEPSRYRLGCGHAVYCSEECMNEHVSHQIAERGVARCPCCRAENEEHKVSQCVNYYKK